MKVWTARRLAVAMALAALAAGAWRAWSVAGELSFNHLSDGGLSDRNYGVHALGLAVGLARDF